MISRRHGLILALAPWLAPRPAGAAPRLRSGLDPLRVGVDRSLSESGLAAALQRGFVRDTGIALVWAADGATAVLTALERGEVDAALTNLPDAEARLEAQGLAHDRRAVATGAFVLVGPAASRAAAGGAKAEDRAHGDRRGKGPDRPRDPDATSDRDDRDGDAVAQALVGLRDAAAGADGPVRFVSVADGSGAHLAELAAWRRAGIAPAPPWYVVLPQGSDLIEQARARAAYAFVEQGAWLARGGAPLAIRVAADPRDAEAVHVLRAFRAEHPAGRLFAAWISGPKGRAIVQRQRGYRAPAG